MRYFTPGINSYFFILSTSSCSHQLVCTPSCKFHITSSRHLSSSLSRLIMLQCLAGHINRCTPSVSLSVSSPSVPRLRFSRNRKAAETSNLVKTWPWTRHTKGYVKHKGQRSRSLERKRNSWSWWSFWSFGLREAVVGWYVPSTVSETTVTMEWDSWQTNLPASFSCKSPISNEQLFSWQSSWNLASRRCLGLPLL